MPPGKGESQPLLAGDGGSSASAAWASIRSADSRCGGGCLALILGVQLFVCLCSGTLYVFGLLAPDLKQRMGFSQESLNVMFDCVYVGSGVLSAVVNFFVRRLGPLKVLFTLALLCGLCWAFILLSAYFVIGYNTGSFCVYFVLIGLSLASYFTVFVEWDLARVSGPAMMRMQAAMVAAYGVGGAVCTVIYMFVFERQPNGVLPFMVLLTVLYTGPTMVVTLLMALYQRHRRTSGGRAGEPGSAVGESIQTEAPEPEPVPTDVPMTLVIKDVLRTPRYWCLFASLFLSSAIGAGVQANLGNLVLALDVPSTQIAWMEIVFAVGQAIGRVGFGFLATVRLPFSNVALLPLPLLCQLVGCALYFLQPSPAPALIALVGLTSLGYGGAWSLAPVQIKYMPHSTRFGEVWALVVLGAGLGPMPLGFVIGALYDRYVPPGQLLCTAGTLCFRGGFIVLSVASAVGVLVSAMFVWSAVRADAAAAAQASDKSRALIA